MSKVSVFVGEHVFLFPLAETTGWRPSESPWGPLRPTVFFGSSFS